MGAIQRSDNRRSADQLETAFRGAQTKGSDVFDLVRKLRKAS